MKDMEITIQSHRDELRARRNEQLRIRLAEEKTFEQLLSELAALKGFNVAEREQAA